MNWLVRIDRDTTAVRLDADSRAGTVVHRSVRRWKIGAGDVILFISGRGLHTFFHSIGHVADVQQSEIEQRRGQRPSYRYALKITDVTQLPENLTLEDMMYSLTKVSNFRIDRK